MMSNNLHEVHAYNQLAQVALGDVVVVMQARFARSALRAALRALLCFACSALLRSALRALLCSALLCALCFARSALRALLCALCFALCAPPSPHDGSICSRLAIRIQIGVAGARRRKSQRPSGSNSNRCAGPTTAHIQPLAPGAQGVPVPRVGT